MITTRTRILSILATVAMLASMLACFVIPASAAAADMYTAIYNDAESGAEALKEALDSNADEATLAAAATGITFKSTAKPRYAWKAAYAAAGYTGTDYAISEVADWVAMGVDAKAASGDYFSGLTFHLTKDIDFANAGIILPLGNGTNSFLGTLDGHGYGFSNIHIICTGSADYKPLSSDSVGLFYYLGTGAEIKDFGLNSGEVVAHCFGGGGCATSFGCAKGAAKLTRVWSGAAVRSTSSGHACAFVGNSENKGVIINGAYFYGILGTYSKVSFTVAGAAYQNAAQGNTYKNIISDANVRFNTNGGQVNGKYPGTDSITTEYGFAMFRNPTGAALIENVYGVTGEGKVPYSYANITGSITSTGFHNANVTCEAVVGAWLKSDVMDAVVAINNNPSATDPVYYSFNANGDIRPVADATNKIIKVTVSGDVNKVGYFNAGTIDLAADLGLYVGEGATYTLGAETLGATVDVAGDVEIIAAINQTGLVGAARAELAPLVEKYAAYDPAVMADGTLAAFKAAVAAANEAAGAENEVELVNAAIAAADDVNLAVSTTYPNFPQYKDYAIYKDYNAGNNWLIKEPADWLAMITDSASNAFAGYKFHLANDITFNQSMRPLGYGNTFNGVLDGHGYAFYNVSLTATSSDTGFFAPIYKVTTGTVKNFGVASGTVNGVAMPGNGALYTAGVVGQVNGAGTIYKVWNGATVKASNGAWSYAAGVVGQVSTGSSQHAVINGCYNVGKLYGSTGAGANENYTGGVIAGGTAHYSVITNNWTIDDMIIGTGSNTFATVFRINQGLTEIARNNYGAGSNLSNRNYGTTPANRYGELTLVSKDDYTSGKLGYVMNQYYVTNPTITGYDNTTVIPNVYYTLKDGKIVHGADDGSDQIVKIEITGDVVATKYANKGTTVNFADLGIDLAPTTTIAIGGIPYEGTSIALTGDVEIDVDYDTKTMMEAVMAPFINMDAKHLSNGDDLTALKEAYADALAANDEAAMADVVDVATAFVPAITTDYKNLPAYSDYAIYAAYNTANNWAITEAADWLAMVAESDGTSVTFDGYNFHLTNDVAFNGAMKPLCAKGQFKGNIDGHGYGFDNVLINETTIESDYAYIGLIYNMIKGSVKNFGINSGKIDASKTSNNAYTGAIFGAIDTAMVSTDILIQKVWNAADVDTAKTNAQKSGAALAGYINNSTGNNKYLVINGFYNSGNVTNHSTFNTAGELYTGVINSTSCLHYNNGVFNSLNSGVISTTNTGGGAMFLRLALWAPGTAVNNASVGTLRFITYSSGDAPTIQYYNGFATAEEAAYKLNQGSTGHKSTDGAIDIEPVYYTITAKGIRPTGTANNQIVKVTITVGEATQTLYVNKGTEYGIADLAAALGVDAAKITAVTVDGEPATGNITITGDTAIVVTLKVCDHTANTNAPVWDGANGHKTVCSECDAVIASGDCDGSWIAGGVDMGTGVSAHTMICTVCNQPYEEDCNGTLVADTADCTKDSKYVFTCGVHNAEYVIEGSGNANHTYEGEWIKDGDLEYRKCVNCEVKETREACKHTVTKVEWVEGTETHKIVCANAECGALIDTVACGGTWAAGEVDLTNGTSKHTKTCPDCKHDYEVACNGNLVADTTDCTKDSKYVFECGVHNAEYVIAGSGYADHDFSASEWTPAEGAAGTKQSKTCAHCSAKIYQIIGGAEAAGVELKADAAGNIVLTLPIALKSAKLTFTVSAGYTVTNVEGAAADAGVYTVANTAAGATVTITVDSALSAIGGVLEVAVTDAIAEDDTAVTDAIAQATIGFTAKEGDVNGDEAVNLSDALAVLYVVAGTNGAETINAYNANVVDPATTDVNVNDVYEIVRIWLRDVVLA